MICVMNKYETTNKLLAKLREVLGKREISVEDVKCVKSGKGCQEPFHISPQNRKK